MKWEKFEESKTELPEVIVEKLIEGFSIATKDLAQLSVIEFTTNERLTSKLKTRFQFKLILSSKDVPDYSFKVLEFGYAVNIYPVKLIISNAILFELNNNSEAPEQILNSEKDFKEAVELVFSTKSFTEIVSGLMKIAKRHSIF